MSETTIKTLHPFLQHHRTSVSSGGQITAYSHDHGSGPILCMVHGWPQSSYMWRHIISRLKDQISLFIPELPGYGISSASPQPDKRTVGNLLVEALQQIFGGSRPVIWCGHDRGARVGHRLLVDDNPAFNIKAAILMDIVPTSEQFKAFAKPSTAIAYYHWSLLPLPDAPQLIERIGGKEFCLANLRRIQGENEAGAATFRANDAMNVYSDLFSKSETIVGSCADYQSAAQTEWKEQDDDQAAGRKVKAPVLVLYSASNLGKMHDVPILWKDWTDGELKIEAIGNGYGHFLPEECPEIVVDHVLKWIEHVHV